MSASQGRLHDRRIVITGAASGLGEAAARMFAREGAALALLDRNGSAVSALAGELRCFQATVDVANESDVGQALAEANKALGGIDGIVNSAGIMCADKLADLTLETWERVMAVNLTGPFLVCRAALPYLLAAERATIVTIASGQALMPGIAGSAYAASKAGTMLFTKSLAAELAPRIRANVVCPGAAATPMANGTLGALDAAGRAAFVSKYALGRLSEPDEVAAALLFLTSHESSSVTGIALAVDGGRTFH